MQNGKLSDRFKNTGGNFEEPDLKSNKNDELKNNLIEKVNSVPYWNEYSLEKQRDMVKSFVENSDVVDKEPVCDSLVPYVTGFGALQNLLDNENVSAVFVNDINSVHIEINGRVFNAEMKLSNGMLQYILNIAGNRTENVYTHRSGDYLIDVIKPEVCKSGVNITIRKIKNFDAAKLIESGMLTKEILDFIKERILDKKRIVISGGINSGKTTLMDVLIKSCLTDKRCYLFEKIPFITAKSDLLTKFDVSKENYGTLLAMTQKALPEYIVSDLNSYDNAANISTLRAISIENAFSAMLFEYGKMPEKSAKLKILKDVDYIIFLDCLKVVSIAELKPARTLTQSVNIIYGN